MKDIIFIEIFVLVCRNVVNGFFFLLIVEVVIFIKIEKKIRVNIFLWDSNFEKLDIVKILMIWFVILIVLLVLLGCVSFSIIFCVGGNIFIIIIIKIVVKIFVNKKVLVILDIILLKCFNLFILVIDDVMLKNIRGIIIVNIKFKKMLLSGFKVIVLVFMK